MPGSTKLFINGVRISPYISTDPDISGALVNYVKDFYLGGFGNSNGFDSFYQYTGDINYARLGHKNITESSAETEYNNVSNIASFWTVGA